MHRTPLVFAASAALLTGSPTLPAAPPQTTPSHARLLQAAQPDLGDAFQAAWGSSVSTQGPFTFLAAFSQLHPLGEDRYALISTAWSNRDMGHHTEQALAVRYLVLTPAGYQATDVPAAMVSDLTFGSVAWSVRDDLLDTPVLVAEFPSGGDRGASPTNIGAYLIALAPDRPVVRSARIPLSCGLDLRFPDDDRIKGELSSTVGDRFLVTYTGSHPAMRAYAPNADGLFVAASGAADLKWCGLP